MSTHNIIFHGEIRKVSCGYTLLSGAMTEDFSGTCFSCFFTKEYVVGTTTYVFVA